MMMRPHFLSQFIRLSKMQKKIIIKCSYRRRKQHTMDSSFWRVHSHICYKKAILFQAFMVKGNIGQPSNFNCDSRVCLMEKSGIKVSRSDVAYTP